MYFPCTGVASRGLITHVQRNSLNRLLWKEYVCLCLVKGPPISHRRHLTSLAKSFHMLAQPNRYIFSLILKAVFFVFKCPDRRFEWATSHIFCSKTVGQQACTPFAPLLVIHSTCLGHRLYETNNPTDINNSKMPISTWHPPLHTPVSF